VEDQTGSESLNDAASPMAADAILAEAQRRMQLRAQPSSGSGGGRRWAIWLNRGVYALARHWLAVFNLLIGLYFAGAILAPLCLKVGWTGAGNMLYAFYDVSCHQYPFRSWFLFGERGAYPLTEPTSVVRMAQTMHFNGDAVTGYKMALCQRDIAMYGAIVLFGLGYGVLRSQRTVRPLPLWQYFVFGVLPMALDGGIQWISYALWMAFPAWISHPFETIPLMRALTGALFGWGLVAASYPHFEGYFNEIIFTLRQRFGWA